MKIDNYINIDKKTMIYDQGSTVTPIVDESAIIHNKILLYLCN